MANIVRLFGVDIHVVSTCNEHESRYNHLRAFGPEIVSKGGGGITHCVLHETCFQEHDQKGSTIDDHVGRSTSRLSNAEEDDVDTTLKLSTNAVSRKSDPPVYNPMPLGWIPPGFSMPLRWIPPRVNPDVDFRDVEGYDGNAADIFANNHVDATLNLNHAGRSSNRVEKGGKSKKRKQDNVGDDRKKRRKRDNGNDDDQNPIPIPIPPGLLQTMESRNGTRPVFLYRKKLEETDASGHHNRLLVNRREKFKQFLTKEEESTLNKGLEIFGVDSQGKLYKLCLKIWESVETLVVKSGWNKLVNGNDAKRGDWIEMWGYRENEKPRLAINFRKKSEHPNFGSS